MFSTLQNVIISLIIWRHLPSWPAHFRVLFVCLLLCASHLTQSGVNAGRFEHGLLVCIVLNSPETAKLQDKACICLCRRRVACSQATSGCCQCVSKSASALGHCGWFLFILTWEPSGLSCSHQGSFGSWPVWFLWTTGWPQGGVAEEVVCLSNTHCLSQSTL